MPFRKLPTDALDFSFEWASWLPSGDSLSTLSYSVAPSGELTIAVSPAPAISGTVTTCWLTGGLTGRTYDLRCQVTTSAGRTKTFRHPVEIA